MRFFFERPKPANKVLNLRADSKRARCVTDFRDDKKNFIIRLRLLATDAIFEALPRAMWISDYRVADFSAPFRRVTLAPPIDGVTVGDRIDDDEPSQAS